MRLRHALLLMGGLCGPTMSGHARAASLGGPIFADEEKARGLVVEAPSHEAADGIYIVGSPAFIAATKEALAALKEAGYSDEIKSFIHVIKQSRCSGMNVQQKIFNVGDPTWKKGLTWYAGTIAHDSRHSRLYSEAQLALKTLESAAITWAGAEAERKCMAFQLTILQALKADKRTLAYIHKTMENPTYQDIGKGKADVCEDRNW